jgi:hypothetical protein
MLNIIRRFMFKRFLFQGLPYLIIPIIFYGCGEEDCLSNYTSTVTIQFVNLADEQPVPLYTQVYAHGDNDILLYNSEEPNHTFVLPVNPGADFITYLFRNDLQSDLITLTYSRRARVLSSNCDLEHRFLNLAIHPDPALTTVDSLVIEKNVLSNPFNEINVKVYN